MESRRIQLLLQKYFDAETSLEEENELIIYFTSGEVEESLKMYVSMFSGLKELSVEEDTDLGEELMNHILESEHKEKLKYRWMWQVVTGIAASVIVALLAVNFYSGRNQWTDTYTDPKQACAEATKTLEYVAGKYHQGLAQLKPIGKITEATDPLYSGMSKLNKGFGLFKTKQLNKKTKNE